MTFYFYVFLIVTIVFLQLSASFDHRPLHSVSRVRNFQIGSSRTRHVQPVQDDQRCSQQPRLGIQKLASNIIGKGLLSASLLFSLSGVPVFAVGELFEFKDRPMILQDISFNVDDAAKEQQMVDALFQQKIRLIRDQSSSTDNKLVVGYGADYYKSPESFHPGVSDFQEDGGHATLTFRSKKASASSDVSELIDRGDGLLYVKMGTETIRLSKAIQQGIGEPPIDRFLFQSATALVIYLTSHPS